MKAEAVFQNKKRMADKERQHINNEVRIKIIEHACKLFLQMGVKDVKMDDIAIQLKISKRTIYEQFTDKKELLYECLNISHNYLRNKLLPYLKSQEISSFEKILMCYSLYFKILEHTNKKFFIDLKKYPEIKEERLKQEAHNEKIFTMWLKQCIKDGYLRKDIEVGLIRNIIKNNLEKLTISTEYPEYTPEVLGRSFILFYMRGIATEKGEKIIEKYIQNNNLSLDL